MLWIDNYNLTKLNVAELSFNKFIIFTIIFFYQIEIFTNMCYNNYIQLNKFLKEKKKLNTEISSFSYNNNIVIGLSIILLVLTKGSTSLPLVIFLVSILCIFFLNFVLIKLNYVKQLTINFYGIILPNAIFILSSLYYVSSFLSFFFFIEMFGVIYYFSFLTTYSLTNQTLLKYKNGLLLLLWNNFLTTVFLALSCFFLIQNFGTTDFIELTYLTKSTWIIYLYLVGLSWKLGLPIFHFFKLEVYKYLLRENVFLFSVLTIIFNIIILYFFMFQHVVFSSLYLNNLIILPVIFTINLMVINLKLHNILHYFALSSMLTITTIFCLFLL